MIVISKCKANMILLILSLISQVGKHTDSKQVTEIKDLRKQEKDRLAFV